MKREKLTARKANIDRLYEESVQCPEFEVSFIKKLLADQKNITHMMKIMNVRLVTLFQL